MFEQDVLRFLRSEIAPLWTLELLLLIARDAARDWSIDGVYRCSPASAELERLVRRTAEAYATYPLAVTEAVLSAPSSKIQLFADAFCLKKE